MANITKLSRLVGQVQRNVDLDTNTLVVGALKVGGLAGTDLTKTILDNLILLQGGGDAGSLHHHDARYYDKTYINNEIAALNSAISSGDAAVQQDVDDEIARALAAEEVLQDNIDAEAATRLAADDTLQDNIDAEEAARIAADDALELAISQLGSSLTWRPGAKVLTSDADLNAAADGTALSTLLPFSDDEGSQLTIADFAANDYILSSNGASSKLFKVVDDGGTLEVTTVDVAVLVDKDTFVVTYDLSDSPGERETLAIYSYRSGASAGLFKLGDIDWAVATGIDLSGGFASSTGTVVAGDSVETAISKLVGNLAAEIARALAAEEALQDDIDAEIARATAAEGVLQDNIEAEETRALAAEGLLDDKIDQEIADREAAIEALEEQIANAGVLKEIRVAGEAFAANTTFAVRLALSTENAGRVYKSTKDATTIRGYNAIGLAQSATSVSIAGNITVVTEGTVTLMSNDTPFSSGDIGAEVFVGASGAMILGADFAETANEAVYFLGVVEDTNKIRVGSKHLRGIY